MEFMWNLCGIYVEFMWRIYVENLCGEFMCGIYVEFMWNLCGIYVLIHVMQDVSRCLQVMCRLESPATRQKNVPLCRMAPDDFSTYAALRGGCRLKGWQA